MYQGTNRECGRKRRVESQLAGSQRNTSQRRSQLRPLKLKSTTPARSLLCRVTNPSWCHPGPKLRLTPARNLCPALNLHLLWCPTLKFPLLKRVYLPLSPRRLDVTIKRIRTINISSKMKPKSPCLQIRPSMTHMRRVWRQQRKMHRSLKMQKPPTEKTQRSSECQWWMVRH